MSNVDHAANSALPACGVLIPVHNLGWVLCRKQFPKKTPEESDDAQTLHENRELSDISG